MISHAEANREAKISNKSSVCVLQAILNFAFRMVGYLIRQILSRMNVKSKHKVRGENL